MKKDLRSYKEHDKDFHSEHNSFERTKEIIREYDTADYFRMLGFKLAIDITKNLPTTHVDIGSGNGWLLRKTSSYFDKVIGVEPSSQGIEVAKKTVEECRNVEFINADMVDACEKLDLSRPLFVTTATVLNHIENDYVAHFLSKVNKFPEGSVLFFDERYDTNINWKMWHVRSKDWWRTQLPTWQLFFFDINVSGYRSGIYGIKTSSTEHLTTKNMSSLEKIFWYSDMLKNITIRVVRKLLKLCGMR